MQQRCRPPQHPLRGAALLLQRDTIKVWMKNLTELGQLMNNDDVWTVSYLSKLVLWLFLLNLIFSLLFFYLSRFLIPAVFNELYDVFLGPAAIIRWDFSTWWNEVQSWITLDFKAFSWDIIGSCVLESDTNGVWIEVQEKKINMIILITMNYLNSAEPNTVEVIFGLNL